MNTASQSLGADTHLAVVDALYRFAAGQDLRDAELFRSAWAAGAELDFQQPARRLGVELPPFRGRDAIVESIMGATAGLHTTHTVTNPRLQPLAEGRVRLQALVEAQHVARDDASRHLLLKNIYDCEVVREEGDWRIGRMHIANVWLQGDPKVLFPG